MALRGKVHHRVHGVLPHGLQHAAVIADVGVDKAEIRLPPQSVQAGQVARVGEGIVGNDSVSGVAARPVVHEVGADETRSPGYQQ